MNKQRWKWVGALVLVVSLALVLAVTAVVWLSAPADVPREVEPFVNYHTLPSRVVPDADFRAYVDVVNPAKTSVSQVYLWVNATCTPDPGGRPMVVSLWEVGEFGNIIDGPLDICTETFVMSPRNVPGFGTATWFMWAYTHVGRGTIAWTLRVV